MERITTQAQLPLRWCHPRTHTHTHIHTNTHTQTLTHTTFFVCFAAALTAALLAEPPTCCCCCCCSARSRHFPARSSVSAAKARPKLGSPQDLIGCLNYSGGVGVSGKKTPKKKSNRTFENTALFLVMSQTFLYRATNCNIHEIQTVSDGGWVQKKRRKQERGKKVSCLSATACGHSFNTHTHTHKHTHTGAAPCRVPMCVIRPIRATLEGLEDC